MLDWNRLLSEKRLGMEDEYQGVPNQIRSEFQRDYDRIIFSSPFRRLQNKTQVFPLPGSIFVHNRLTHSLEVASVGRSLGTIIANKLRNDNVVEHQHLLDGVGAIVSAACLAHDLGNPPFGHSGEAAISEFFLRAQKEYNLLSILSSGEFSDLSHFEGNANTLRLLTHQFNGRRQGGFSLTYSTLSAVMKYPCTSDWLHKPEMPYKKYGVFCAETSIMNRIANELGIEEIKQNLYARHPLVFLVEAADDICYQIVDLEDAHRLGILSTSQTIELMRSFFDPQTDKNSLQAIDKLLSQLTDENEQITTLRSRVINKLIEECIAVFWQHYPQIMNCTFHSNLLDNATGTTHQAIREVKKVAKTQIYSARMVLEIQVAGHNILGELLHEYLKAVLENNTLYASQLLHLLPSQLSISENDTPYGKILSIVDFIAGMTDIYALELYRKIKGISFSIQR